ncbi:uncharacterized protein LOC128840167 [Malaclemys terrapin pileata]|uniref:uncharacterized protein LOC128840167 n=1 Tax=Malaclemys terrapin pileata TaxID=2991368 RepID=UPI0023A7C2DE|nr:uncharacterized protein LOC128840167 [Malaclemys terrapin pileata]
MYILTPLCPPTPLAPEDGAKVNLGPLTAAQPDGPSPGPPGQWFAALHSIVPREDLPSSHHPSLYCGTLTLKDPDTSSSVPVLGGPILQFVKVILNSDPVLLLLATPSSLLSSANFISILSIPLSKEKIEAQFSELIQFLLDENKVLLEDLQAEEQKAIAIMQNTMKDHEVKMKLLEEEIADVQEKVPVSFSGGSLFNFYFVSESQTVL